MLRCILLERIQYDREMRQPKCSATVGNDLSPDTSASFFEANESHSQSAMEKSLLVAIALGQYETVRAALERSSPDLDYQDAACDGNSALHLAVLAKHNKTRLIELLIEAGADCDLRNHDDLTPVELALANGSQYVAEFALSRELDGVPDEEGLRRLIRRGSVELLRIFLEKRAFDIHTKMKLFASILDELSVKGVPIERSMSVFLEYELIAHSYEGRPGGGAGSKRAAVKGKAAAGANKTEADRRVELVLSYTKYLSERYDPDNLNDLDDGFVVRLRALCECLHYLDGVERWPQLKLVPVGELSYLCGVLLAILEKSAGFEMYKLVLNKHMMVRFLRAVAEELEVLVRPSSDHHQPTVRSFQWTPQLLLDLIACIREQKLSQYVARRQRACEALHRIATSNGPLTPADEALRTTALTVGQLWHRTHPKLRLPKRQVAYVASRRELLAKVRAARQLAELSRGKVKLLEREVAARELKGSVAGRAVRRRNRAVFGRLRRTYEQVRQMHTVKQIAYYVENALVLDLDDQANASLCSMAIQRVLQYIGQVGEEATNLRRPTFARMLTNLLDHVLSPLVNTGTTPQQVDLRDNFTPHCTVGKYFLSKALTLEQVRTIQDRLKPVYRFCLYAIHIQLIEAYKTFLGTAYRLRNVAQLRSYARYIGEYNLHTLSHIKFEHVFYDERETGRIVQELKKMYLGMANELKLLSFIEKNIHFRFYHMQYHQTRLRVTLANFATVYRALKANEDYGCVRRLVHSYLRQSYQKYDISRSISISDANLALKELLRPYSSLSENEESLQVVRHLEELQRLMDPDRLFGINLGRRECASAHDPAARYGKFTRKMLQDLSAPPLSDEEFEQLHERLSRTSYGNIFLLQQRYKTVEEFFRTKGLALEAGQLQAHRKQDEELLQELFDSRVNEVVEMLEKFDCTDVETVSEAIEELPPAVQFALEYGLVELLEILTTVGRIEPMHWNFQSTVLSGCRLKGFLAGGHESLVLEAVTRKSSATIFLNVLAFKQRAFQLYSGEPPTASCKSVSCWAQKYASRLQWIEQQQALFEAVRSGSINVSALRQQVQKGVAIDGQLLGALMPNESCRYGLIDAAIAGDFRAMIDLLTGAPQNSERTQLLQYLLRRTAKSHFLDERLEEMKESDHRMLVLYLCLFHGDVALFRKHLKRFNASDELHLFVNSEDHRFVRELLAGMHDYDWSRADGNGMTILHKLVNAGNLAAVEHLIGKMSRKQLNALCSMKYSALNLAARLNLLDIVRVLVGAKVSLNVMSEDEKLPVYWLIQYGNPRSVVRQTIDAATELTAFSGELCLLHRSIEYDNEDVLRYLIEECKVDPSRIYSNCNNVLHVAAGFDRCRILRYLLTLPGLRKIVNNCNLVKNSPLHVACKEGYVRSARILLEEGGASTDACGEYGLNALAFALYTNNGRLVRCLFRQEASIGGALSSDFQPINMAIRNGNLRMLELLLRRGVDVNSAPLCFINAVCAESRDIVRLLIERGARHVNHRDEFCQTALHVCVERDQVEMARDLIRAGAQINAKNRTGATPLHLAVQRGNVRLVQLLLDHKCSIDELNYNGETPLIRAVVSNNLPLVRILLNNGASIERLRNSEPPVLLYLVQENHEEVLDYLLEHYQQFDANEQDAYGNTLLYVATQHNHINIVKLLVGKYGARANPTNHKQLTPLMIARVKAYKEIFHFLEARLVEE
uniref:Ion transport domain-containing protein n=1 Tax=Anopheles coluzzii TaxID=1518534 RepID=A0A8W7PIQ9_ANOCL